MKKIVEKMMHFVFLGSVIITVPSYIVWITSAQNTIVQLR
jgi:hypothetical protein